MPSPLGPSRRSSSSVTKPKSRSPSSARWSHLSVSASLTTSLASSPSSPVLTVVGSTHKCYAQMADSPEGWPVHTRTPNANWGTRLESSLGKLVPTARCVLALGPIRPWRVAGLSRLLSSEWPSLGWLLTLQRGAHQPHLRRSDQQH